MSLLPIRQSPLPYSSRTGASEAGAADIWGRQERRAASGNAGIFFPRGFCGCRVEGDNLDICRGACLPQSVPTAIEHRAVRCSIVGAIKYFLGRAGPFSEEHSTVINGNPTSRQGLIKVFLDCQSPETPTHIIERTALPWQPRKEAKGYWLCIA